MVQDDQQTGEGFDRVQKKPTASIAGGRGV
jgi:hypothetical protein